MEVDSEFEDPPLGLNLLAEKIVHLPIKIDNLAYCPTMDLIALATVDEHVHVYRLNGQRVFAVSNRKPDCSVRQLRWKPNGQILAISYSDSSVSLISAQTGKSVHQLQYREHSQSKISCLGWGLNYTDADETRARLDNLRIDINLDDVLNTGSQSFDAERPLDPLDLPNDLAFLDIEDVLPKLSILPATGGDDEVFSSRSSMDAIFHSSKKDNLDDTADVLLVGYDDGTIHLSIYDFFEIGILNTQLAFQDHQIRRLILHSNHSLCSTHSLLLSQSRGSLEELHFVPLDLRLIPETGRYLSLLASKSTRLQNVLRYVREVQVQIYREFSASQELPRKFMRNIEETLQETNQCSFIDAAYHLVVTGNCFPSMKEWLVEELGDRGHKRWDKAVVSGYENIGRLVHENLLPALQRFSVLVSRLRGLSRFQESITQLGLGTEELDHMLDTVNCLQLLAHSVLITVGSECRQFSAFSVWLKQEIETQGTTTTSPSDESLEQDLILDHALILEYIQGAMSQSRLSELFGIQPESDGRPDWISVNEDVSIYETYKKEVKRCNQGLRPERKLPGLDGLIARLGKQSTILFHNISEAQKRKVRFGKLVTLGTGKLINADMRMISERGVPVKDEYTTYIAMIWDGSPAKVMIHRVVIRIVNGISSIQAIERASIHLPSGVIKDVKFADDETMILAYTEEATKSHLLYIPYRKGSQSLFELTYVPVTSERSPTNSLGSTGNFMDLSRHDAIKHYIQHTFPSDSSWTPETIEVNGRKGRRAICVVAQDRTHYRIFDLDSPKVEDGLDIKAGPDETTTDDGSHMAVEPDSLPLFPSTTSSSQSSPTEDYYHPTEIQVRTSGNNRRRTPEADISATYTTFARSTDTDLTTSSRLWVLCKALTGVWAV
ncbi:hypothetical protein MMC11_006188 [Xylographa trunciseda]|nr:hypothetical protein [Xylographa trunciseda]